MGVGGEETDTKGSTSFLQPDTKYDPSWIPGMFTLENLKQTIKERLESYREVEMQTDKELTIRKTLKAKR